MGVGVLAVRHEPASAALVRQAIAADLMGQCVTRAAVDDVILVASELVGNAVVHAASSAEDPLDVLWDLEDGTVLVQVADASSAAPAPRALTTTETSGRGLAIVAALADDWGVRPTPTGKQVWARIPVSRTA